MRVLPDQGGGIQVEIAPKGRRLASLLTTWGYLRKMGKMVFVRPILLKDFSNFAERSANVDAVEGNGLLRATQQVLETLGRRHPRIVTRVFRNLDEILATRLVHVIERLG